MRFCSLLLLTAIVNAACSDWPSSPTGLSGYSASIVSVDRPFRETELLFVTVEYQLAERLDDAMIWTCVARTPETVLISSCRSKPLLSLSGRLQSETGLLYINRVPVVDETRYVMAFLTSGKLHDERSYPPPGERKITDLTRKIAARASVEMVWTWRPF
jgi:hypothetical protein